MSSIKVNKPRVDEILIQSFYFCSKKEKSLEKFNLLTLSNVEIWDIIRLHLEHILKARYVNHTIIEKFIKEYSIKGTEIGTVKYYLTIEYLLAHEKL